MFNLYLALLVIAFLLLVLVAGMRPTRSSLSKFEIERRANGGDKDAKELIRREILLGYVLSLQRIKTALLLVLTVIFAVIAFDWVLGIIIATFIAIEYGAVSRLRPVRKLAQSIYLKSERFILKQVDKFSSVFKFIGSVAPDFDEDLQRLSSREELQHLIDQSDDILTPDEKKLVVHSLSFGEKLVSSVMTPRGMIESISKTEFLGPLTLDELHQKGHSRLPVVNGDIDHVIGILHLRSLLALDIKRSATAEKAMEPRVYYIREDQNLQHALAAFLRTRHHLFIVVNEFRETVGLLTLEDVMEALLGHKIVDEFDAHDDLRAVALRNVNKNNHPKNLENV